MRMDDSVRNFSTDPGNYVLYVEREDNGTEVLKAERKVCILTWFKVHVFCQHAYSLSRIIGELNNEEKINSDLQRALLPKISSYNRRHAIGSEITLMTNEMKAYVAKSLHAYIPNFLPFPKEEWQPVSRVDRLDEIVLNHADEEEGTPFGAVGIDRRDLQKLCLLIFIRESARSFKEVYPNSDGTQENLELFYRLLRAALQVECGQRHSYGNYKLNEANVIEEIASKALRNL